MRKEILTCDRCFKDIKTDDINGQGLGMFKAMKIVPKLKLDMSKEEIGKDKELVSDEKDLCYNCSEKVLEFIDSFKKEKDKK